MTPLEALSSVLLRDSAEEALRQLKLSGFVIVPIEPTERMLDEGRNEAEYITIGPFDDEEMADVWRAMVKAAS